MKKQLALVALGLVVVLVASAQLARALAGPSPTDIQDALPAWSSNGVDIAFQRGAAGQTSRVLDMRPSGKSVHFVGDGQLRGWVPGTEHLLIQVDEEHTLVQPDSFNSRPLAEFLGSDATASPDGQSVAYLRGGTLFVASIAGGGERPIAAGIAPPSSDVVGPVWSRDGTHIVVASGTSLVVANANGTAARTIPDAGPNPSLDPAGTTIAFERNVGGEWQIWLVGSDGSAPHELLGGAGANYRFPTFSTAYDGLAFITDKQHLIGGATKFQYALYLRDPNTGAVTKLLDDVHPFSPPAWDPNGPWLAVAAGQECRRWGVYEVPLAGNGYHGHRASNICRFTGTWHADTIHGSPYFDRINGLGGNDRVYGLSGNDEIVGGSGNDTIYGGAGNDFILAGPGNDVVYGGPGNDTIIPGNGHDRIDCGPGIDTVEGAGPLDTIAKNCEHVRR